MWPLVKNSGLFPSGIRGRMMLLIFFITVVIFIISHLLVYQMLSSRFLDIVDHELAEEMIEYTQAVKGEKIKNEKELAAFSETYFPKHIAEGYMHAERMMLFAYGDGLAASGENARELVKAPKKPKEFSPYGAYTYVNSSGQELRMISSSIMINKRKVGTILMAETLQPINNLLRTTILSLGGSMIIAIALVLIFGSLVSKQILAPITRMATVAEAITKEDLSQRINYQGSNDEVYRLAQTFDAMINRLETAFNEKKRFISDASHELRTPITIIKGHLEVLRLIKDPSEQDYKEALTVVLDELERMNRLVNNLLLLARSSTSDFLLYVNIDLPEFMRTIYHKADKLADRRWILEDIPNIFIRADRDKLTEVLLNLLQNASEHTSKPTDSIKLSAEINEDWLSIRISDTGTGIPQSELKNIFQRFYRGDKARSKKVSGVGVGLGLSLVQAIVNAHGGKVDVKSEVGRGSTFSIYLPYSQSAQMSYIKVSWEPV